MGDCAGENDKDSMDGMSFMLWVCDRHGDGVQLYPGTVGDPPDDGGQPSSGW